MRESDFQFTNPILKEIQFGINDEFEAESEEIGLDLRIQVNKNYVADTEAVVELSVMVGEKDSTAPFYLLATEGAIFKWEKEVFSNQEDVDKLLSINAPALLLSYLRPVVANITLSSKYSAYNIPFINFNDVQSM